MERCGVGDAKHNMLVATPKISAPSFSFAIAMEVAAATRAHARPIFPKSWSRGVKCHSVRQEASGQERALEGAVASRRTLLSLSSGVLASGCFPGVALADQSLVEDRSSAAELVLAPEVAPTKDFSAAAGLFSFSYPKRWLVAYDRTNRNSDGPLVFVGDFVNVDTFTVSRRAQTDFVDDNGSLLDASAIADRIISDVRDTPSAMTYNLLDEGERRGAVDGYPYYVVEYVVEVCRGVVEEGIGGNKTCSGPNDLTLETVTRHHILGITKKDGSVFVVSGAALQSRWGAIGSDVLAAFDSFGLG